MDLNSAKTLHNHAYLKAWKLDNSNLQVTFICVNTYVMENCECVCMHNLITLNDLTMFKGLVNTLSCVHLLDEGHNMFKYSPV